MGFECSDSVTALGMRAGPSCTSNQCSCSTCIHLLVCRAEGDGDGLLVHAVRALAVRGEGTAAAGGVKEAGVDLAVTGQAGEDPRPLLEGVSQDLHDLDAGHVPPRRHGLR